MEPNIKVKDDYILVEIEEGEYLEILISLGSLFKMPEYLNKDVIWIFQEAPLKTSYDDMHKLRDFVKNHYPANSAKPDKKAALVVKSGLHKAMAEEYVKIVNGHGPEFRVFSDVGTAEEWIIVN